MAKKYIGKNEIFDFVWYLSVIYAVGQQGWIRLFKKNINEHHFHTMDVHFCILIGNLKRIVDKKLLYANSAFHCVKYFMEFFFGN